MNVQVKDLTKIYGQQKAVNNISFVANTGVLGFLGPNGAGKSTTMKMLTNFLPPTSGNVSICGYDTSIQALDARRNIGYLPENNPLYDGMYVKEALDFMAGVHALSHPAARISEVIELTGLGTEQHKKIEQLSKG